MGAAGGQRHQQGVLVDPPRASGLVRRRWRRSRRARRAGRACVAGSWRRTPSAPPRRSNPLAVASAETEASICSRVRLRAVSSMFAWSAPSEASNSEWSKSKSAAAAAAVAVRRSLGHLAAVLLDRRLLQLGIAVESERLGEAHDRRRRGVGAAGELLGRLEGRLVEMIDDVAGDVLLRARELVEALGDVVGQALACSDGSLLRSLPRRRRFRPLGWLSLPVFRARLNVVGSRDGAGPGAAPD